MKAKDVSIESYINRKPVKRKMVMDYTYLRLGMNATQVLKLTMIKTYGTTTEPVKVVQL